MSLEIEFYLDDEELEGLGYSREAIELFPEEARQLISRDLSIILTEQESTDDWVRLLCDLLYRYGVTEEDLVVPERAAEIRFVKTTKEDPTLF